MKAILAERGDTLSTLSDVNYCIIGKNSSDSEEFILPAGFYEMLKYIRTFQSLSFDISTRLHYLPF